MTTDERILVAGVGNIFFGDDAFGVEVAQVLGRRSLPPHVVVRDFGIRGLDLTYELLDNYAAAILVDITARGAPPGALYVIEPEQVPDAQTHEPLALDPHHLDPAKVLRAARAMGSKVRRVLLVGCEPMNLGSDENLVDGLSAPVRAAIGPAVELIESLIAQLAQAPSPGIQTTDIS